MAIQEIVNVTTSTIVGSQMAVVMSLIVLLQHDCDAQRQFVLEYGLRSAWNRVGH